VSDATLVELIGEHAPKGGVILVDGGGARDA
jgi:hypothetical protein